MEAAHVQRVPLGQHRPALWRNEASSGKPDHASPLGNHIIADRAGRGYSRKMNWTFNRFIWGDEWEKTLWVHGTNLGIPAANFPSCSCQKRTQGGRGNARHPAGLRRPCRGPFPPIAFLYQLVFEPGDGLQPRIARLLSRAPGEAGPQSQG